MTLTSEALFRVRLLNTDPRHSVGHALVDRFDLDHVAARRLAMAAGVAESTALKQLDEPTLDRLAAAYELLLTPAPKGESRAA